jgi:hypothetical protein
MRMEIDKPRRDDESRGVDRSGRRAPGKLADRLDASIAHADVGAHGRRAGAVKDIASGDQHVKGRLRRGRARNQSDRHHHHHRSHYAHRSSSP